MILTLKAKVWKNRSMEKRLSSKNQQNNTEAPESLRAFKEFVSKLGKKELSLVQKKLNFLSLEFDPFNDEELSVEEQNIIEEYELSSYVGSPFAFTNIVLQMLDALETEIKSRQH